MAIPRITADSCGFIPVTDDEYLTLDEGYDKTPIISASAIKRLITQDFQGPHSKIAELGNTVHAFLSRYCDEDGYKVLGPFIGADGRAIRANSKEYQARMEETEAKYGRGNFSVLNNTDFNAAKSTLTGAKEYLDALKADEGNVEITSEQTLVIGKNFTTNKCITPAAETLRQFILPLFPDHHIKSKIDLLIMVRDPMGKMHYNIVDWKTTSKKTLPDIKRQVLWLEDWFQLQFYAMVVEMVTQIPVRTVSLATLQKKNSPGVIVLERELSDYGDEIFANCENNWVERKLNETGEIRKVLSEKKYIVYNG